MADLRRDAVVERWVTIPEERALGVEAFLSQQEPPPAGPCPFCPDQQMKEKEIFAIRDEHGQWRTRVMPDRHPILRVEGTLERQAKGIYDAMNGIGAHEIVVESRDHSASWATMDPAQLAAIFQTYRQRSLDLRRDQRLRALYIAKNHGGLASHYRHPHSHVVALPILPHMLVEEIEGAERHYDYKERCVWCDVREQELENPACTVYLNEKFIVVTPFASRFPFELWILPLQHQADMASASDDDLAMLGRCVRATFEMIQKRLRDPSYSLVIHSAPFRNPPEHSFHWHIEIRPSLSILAGFEWGTGFYTNPIHPEVAAAYLRE